MVPPGKFCGTYELFGFVHLLIEVSKQRYVSPFPPRRTLASSASEDGRDGDRRDVTDARNPGLFASGVSRTAWATTDAPGQPSLCARARLVTDTALLLPASPTTRHDATRSQLDFHEDMNYDFQVLSTDSDYTEVTGVMFEWCYGNPYEVNQGVAVQTEQTKCWKNLQGIIGRDATLNVTWEDPESILINLANVNQENDAQTIASRSDGRPCKDYLAQTQDSGVEKACDQVGGEYMAQKQRFANQHCLLEKASEASVESFNGSLWITLPPDAAAPTSLDSLSALQSVEGDFKVVNTTGLTSLEGLDSLKSVGGDFEISENDVLTSLLGLMNVRQVKGDLAIYNNTALRSLTGLGNLLEVKGALHIGSSLPSVQGLDALTYVQDLKILADATPRKMTGLRGLERLMGVVQGTISSSWDLPLLRQKDISFISLPIKLDYGGKLDNADADEACPSLEVETVRSWLQGLPSNGSFAPSNETFIAPIYQESDSQRRDCDAFGGKYESARIRRTIYQDRITYWACELTNPEIVSDPDPDIISMPFEGTFNGTLRVINMTSLPLEGLTQVEGGLEIGELSSGDLTGELASLDGLQDLKYVAKHFFIDNNPVLENLEGLSSLQMVGRRFTLDANERLRDLKGLDSLTVVGADLEIDANKALESLSGLESLTAIKGNLRIWDNDRLTSLDGLQNLISVEGDVIIWNNDNLEDGLDGLKNLKFIGGNLVINANTITGGVLSIGAGDLVVGGDINIINNLGVSMLDLAVQSVSGKVVVLDNNPLPNSSPKGYEKDPLYDEDEMDLEGKALSYVAGEILVQGNPSLEALLLRGIKVAGGDLTVSSNANLQHMVFSIQDICEDVEIADNPSLNQINGFNSLRAVNGEMRIEGNILLENIEFPSLVYVGIFVLPRSLASDFDVDRHFPNSASYEVCRCFVDEFEQLGGLTINNPGLLNFTAPEMAFVSGSVSYQGLYSGKSSLAYDVENFGQVTFSACDECSGAYSSEIFNSITGESEGTCTATRKCQHFFSENPEFFTPELFRPICNENAELQCSKTLKESHIAAIVGSLVCLAVLLVCGLTGFLVWKHRGDLAAAQRLRKPPNPMKEETTYAMTDIQDSTKLWEELPNDVMATCMKLHHTCLYGVLKECHGYLSYTEGDAFFVAFHFAQDAVKWSLLVQERLLHLPWPQELLDHPAGAEVFERDQVSFSEGDHLLFRGFRVRIGIHSGMAELSEMNKATSKVTYSGKAPSLTKTVCDSGKGGAVIITGSSLGACDDNTLADASPFHCGVYDLSSKSASAISGQANTGAISHTKEEQLVLLLPKGLEQRVEHFPHTLAKGKKLAAHCLEAPRGDVTLSFMYVPVTQSLSEWNKAMASETLDNVNRVCRQTLYNHDGYEAECMPGFFYASFWDSRDAIKWAIETQERLMEVDWPFALLSLPTCEEMKITTMVEEEAVQETVYKGPRVKMGLYSGVCKGGIDPLTGRMQYLGKVANRTARIASKAAQGQILASKEVVKGFVKGLNASASYDRSFSHLEIEDVHIVTAGKMQLKGVSEPLELFTVGSSLLVRRPLSKRPARALMSSKERDLTSSREQTSLMYPASSIGQLDISSWGLRSLSAPADLSTSDASPLSASDVSPNVSQTQ